MGEGFTYQADLVHSDTCHICGENVAGLVNNYYNYEGYEVCQTCFF
jgi:hypothetical protein